MPTTPKMINYAETLIERCGYDINDYDLENMSFKEVSGLIVELREELGLDKEWGGQHARKRD